MVQCTDFADRPYVTSLPPKANEAPTGRFIHCALSAKCTWIYIYIYIYIYITEREEREQARERSVSGDNDTTSLQTMNQKKSTFILNCPSGWGGCVYLGGLSDVALDLSAEWVALPR